MTMRSPLIIGGNEIVPEYFQVASRFYEGCTSQTANARMTDVAAAIGRARRADRGDVEFRKAALSKAAQSFTYAQQDLEHAVRMMGTPIRVVKSLFEDIPRWLLDVPLLEGKRFNHTPSHPGWDEATVQPGMARVYAPPEGFCYAVTPSNDPRSSALVAANLGYLGVPFVLRASPRDAVAPLVIKALIAGGFDPDFCSLLYFDRPGAAQKNFKLVEASSAVWTFGPRRQVDARLRYEVIGRRAVIQLPAGTDAADKKAILALGASQGFGIEEARRDHFAGKTILRHESGNCAAILQGGLSASVMRVIERSILYPLGCTDTKSLYLVDPGSNWSSELEHFLQELVVGDPLDADTQVGYVDPRNLDTLEKLLKHSSLRLRTLGGERISSHQARPLLVVSQEQVPDFFANEIPAYVLAARECENAVEAVDWINDYTGKEPRLAVSLLNVSEIPGVQAASRLRAHAVMINRPTSEVVPVHHEGNDYATTLRRGKLIWGEWG